MASHYSKPDHILDKDDVFLDHGGSGAIFNTLSAMLNPGDNFLAPSPGFTLFYTVSLNLGVECRLYNLKPHQNWEADTE